MRMGSPAAAEWREGVLLDLWVLPGAEAGLREASLDQPACSIGVRIRAVQRRRRVRLRHRLVHAKSQPQIREDSGKGEKEAAATTLTIISAIFKSNKAIVAAL